MASSKVQLDELKKPKPRYVLELYTIRGMIQEADNMDKGLKTVLGMRAQPQMMPPTQPVQPTALPVPAALSRPHVPPLQPTQKETVSGAGPWDGDIHPYTAINTNLLYSDTTGIDPRIYCTVSSDTEVLQTEGRRKAEG
jgi:hypothetical protein